MVFGGIQGLTIFRPDLVTRRRDAPPITFTRWRRETSSGSVEGRLDDASRNELRVGPDDRAIAIDFTALTFGSTPARRYRYRLEGFSPEWVESADHTVAYGALPPGHYVFRVQAAAGSEGVWYEPGASLRMVVVPPLWRTLWFRACVVLFALGGLLLWHRLRLRRALATERLRVRISRDLHDEIGAGLSSIALLTDAAGNNGPMSESARAQLEHISQSARRMVETLSDIVWAIDPGADRLADVVTRMHEVADDLLGDLHVDFQLPPADELSNRIGMAARRDLLLIFTELLHNIARHSHATAVQIRLEARGDQVMLVVADNGRGFDVAALRGRPRARGGRGLMSIRERAARLGGTLDVRSRTNGNGGTTATLTLRST
jgi:signal transduction histidine kinase